MEIRFRFQPKQIAFDRAIETAENVFYGGAKGGGKSHALREIMLKRRFQYPGSRGAIFRKTYPELYNNHIAPILTKFPGLRKFYNAQHKELILPNKSVLMFRYCQYEKDLADHQGQEYHDLGIEEAGEWPEEWFWTLKGSNRSSVPGVVPRCLMTGNPGGIGHKWLKRLFVERSYRGDFERPEDFAFVPATVYDNKALLENDPGYVNRLRANKNPAMVKAYLEGSWDIQAGQFFEMVSRETHVIDPFEIPAYWQRFAGFDHGYNHPAAKVWIAADEDGNHYVYREHIEAKRSTEDHAKQMLSFPDYEKILSIPAGHDCWAKRDYGPTIAEKFHDATGGKLSLIKANIDRVQGATHLRDYLRLGPNGKPRLFFFKTCPITFDAVVRMTHDDKKPEDVMKVDSVNGDPYTGDDAYDALRYAMMSRPPITIAPKPTIRRRRYDNDGDGSGRATWRDA